MKALAYAGIGVLAASALLAQSGNRKVTENEKSPSADTSITLGGSKITVEYNAPSARGRKVEGTLVPYGKVWRLGADNATTLTNDADIMIGDLKVPKGAHTLYIMASESGWKLVVNNQTGQWGTVYKQDQDLGRVDMTTSKGPITEKLKITLHGSGKSGSLDIDFGNTHATVPIKLA